MEDLEFDHVGIVTDEKKEGEVFIEATKVWVTDMNEHPYRVEWLRFEPDTEVTGPLRTQPHVAFRVKDKTIEEHMEGKNIVLEPFFAKENLRVGFIQTEDGALVEFMEYKGCTCGGKCKS
ncbi:MAG: hypothetical protein GXP25_04285 [Planctomycetes bacterium]|nr:hypothetical protein [Planctomycetota bacterium]